MSPRAADGKDVAPVLVESDPFSPDYDAALWKEKSGGIQPSGLAPEGLVFIGPGFYQGYTLFVPLTDASTYLIDINGRVVQKWTSAYLPGVMAYLQDDGALLRAANIPNPAINPAGGRGGLIERLDPDSNVVWQFQLSDDDIVQHHDFEVLPNGNIIMIAWERKTAAEAIAAGRNPALLTQGVLFPDAIVEVQPNATSGTIVWEWHVWDHLIQDFDATKANFGVVGDHPELVDLNYLLVDNSDWNHANGISYHPEFDQIILSVRQFEEFWIIDHSTTTAEAAGHTGGRSGKGGDLLYRWGNPRTYRRGNAANQQLFVQHDTRWIPPGYPGAGNITVFNNGFGRIDGNYSTVVELTPPVDAQGNYSIAPGQPFGPAAPLWIYTADPPESFFSAFISSAHRLSNGNTLICEGQFGNIFEIDPNDELVWRYISPFPDPSVITDNNAVFRAFRYPYAHPGIIALDLPEDISSWLFH